MDDCRFNRVNVIVMCMRRKIENEKKNMKNIQK